MYYYKNEGEKSLDACLINTHIVISNIKRQMKNNIMFKSGVIRLSIYYL